MTRNKTVLLATVFLSLAFSTAAQQFKYESALGDVHTTGFYRIMLGSDILSYLQPDLRDLRIVEDGQQAPYVVSEQTAFTQSRFTAFPILSNETDTGGNTILTVQNLNTQGVDNLSFIIKNNAVERPLSLSGSNDGKRWYIIKENLLLTPGSSYISDEFVQSVSFPLSTYQYLRFSIKNNHSDALNIVRAGVFTYTSEKSDAYYLTHPKPALRQTDSSDGNSYIHITQSGSYPVEQLLLTIEKPRLFEREATLYHLNDSGTARGYILANFTVSSKRAAEYAVPLSNAKRYLLVIANGDNPPLVVNDARFQTRQRMLYAYLEKEKSYKILLGNTDVSAARYDIESFRDSIPPNAPEIKYGTISTATVSETGNKKALDKTWLWIAIVSAVGVLGFFTFKMVKEMNQKGI